MEGKKRIFADFKAKVHMKRKEAAGSSKQDPALSKGEITVQLLSPTVKLSTGKYDVFPGSTEEFVQYPYTELTVENIKKACKTHFNMDGECDILQKRSGPSCTRIDQLLNTKLFYVRFKAKENSPSVTSLLMPPPPRPTHQPPPKKKVCPSSLSLSVLAPVHPPAEKVAGSKKVAKSLSIFDMMRLGRVVEKTTASKTYGVERFDINSTSWSTIGDVLFDIEKESLGVGAFRQAFKAKTLNEKFCGAYVIKRNLPLYDDDHFRAIEETSESHTRKSVQVHALARNLAQSLERKVTDECIDEWGTSFFQYDESMFGYNEKDNESVIIEKMLEGTFDKIINNTGKVFDKQSELTKKGEAFIHFTWDRSGENFMVIDLQGVGFRLTDPEIASLEQFTDNKLNFCAGNISKNAILEFQKNHTCNAYCLALKLKPMVKPSCGLEDMLSQQTSAASDDGEK